MTQTRRAQRAAPARVWVVEYRTTSGWWQSTMWTRKREAQQIVDDMRGYGDWRVVPYVRAPQPRKRSSR